jgi:proteasome assembly chaperone (PAC2) family protein
MDDFPNPGLRGLQNPAVIVAFGGWNDAGTAASSAVEHLADAYDAQLAFSIDPDDFYDFQVNRPQVSMVEDDERVVTWPTTEIRVGRLSNGRDLVLIAGLEPNLRWRQFSALLVSALKSAGADRIFMLGALLADTPHTRPIPVSITTSDPLLAAEFSLPPSSYEGPTGIVGVLGDAAARSGMRVLTLWAAIPHYVSHPPCPKATLALLSQLEELLDTSLDFDDLPELSRAWERGVDELAAEDTEVADYVTALEQQQDATELPEASGDAIAAEFERYLRRRSDG